MKSGMVSESDSRSPARKQADLITKLRVERRPTEVRLHHFPNWLRLRCLKVFGTPWAGGTDGYAALESMRRAVGDQFTHVTWLDHQGSTVLADGSIAWVTEPYGQADKLAPVMKWLAEQLGCNWCVTANSWWFPGATVRGVLYGPGESITGEQR